MMPRKPRRSSILKAPKLVVRAPFQDLDSDEDGTLTQPTSRRVSFSRTSQIKEFDPSIGYMTNWHQSYEESLESIEGDENQAKSANVFDGLSSVQTQKVYKRKRTSTLQLSLAINNDETNGGVCPDSNPSVLQNSGARAVKQPRKSLDCFKTEFVEEGDTTMFYDELNLTEPIKSSYSNVDSSSNLTRTLMDSFLDTSDGGICSSNADLFQGNSAESSSKCVDSNSVKSSSKVTHVGSSVTQDELPIKDPIIIHADQNAPHNAAAKYGPMDTSGYSMNMDCTLASGKIEIGESFIDIEKLGNQQHGNCQQRNTNSDLPKCNDDNKPTSIRGPSIYGEAKNDIKDLLPSSSLSTKDIYSVDNNELLDRNNSLEVSMELTNPLILRDMPMPRSNHANDHAPIIKQAKENIEETEDLEMTGTWGQIVEQKNSVLPSEAVNPCGTVADQPKSLMDILNPSRGQVEMVADNTFSSDMELSVSNDGNIFPDGDGMELTVPVGKLKMLIAKENSENIDPMKPLVGSEVLQCNQIAMVSESNLEALLPKVTERSGVQGDINGTSYANGMDETCGMEMTVSLGKIKEKVSKDADEYVLDSGSVKNTHLSNEPKNDRKLVEILMEGQRGENKTRQDNHASGKDSMKSLEGGEVLKCNQDSLVSHENLETLLPVVTERSCVQGDIKETSYSNAMDETCGMEMTVTFGKIVGKKSNEPKDDRKLCANLQYSLKGENNTKEDSDSSLKRECNREVLQGSRSIEETPVEAVSTIKTITNELQQSLNEQGENVENSYSCSLIGNKTNFSRIGMDMTVPFEGMKDKCNESVENSTAHHHEDVNDTYPNAMGIDFNVPLGELRREVHEVSGNAELTSHAVDSGSPETSVIEATDQLHDVQSEKSEDTLINMMAGSHVTESANPHELDMELTVPLGKLKGVKSVVPPEPVAEPRRIDDTNPDASCMEFTVPLGMLKGGKNIHADDHGLPGNEILDETIPDAMGMEFTVPLGKLTGAKCKDLCEDVPPQNQIVNDTNPDAEGMELTVSLGRLTGEKNINHASHLLPETQAADETNPDMVMELTVPLGRLMGTKCKDPVPSMLPQNQLLNDTNPEMVGMELTVPLGRMKGASTEECTGNLTLTSQIMSVTNAEVMGMELTVPLKKMKSLCVEETFDNSLPPTHTMDVTNAEVIGLGAATPSERMDEVRPTQIVEETLANSHSESKILDGTNPVEKRGDLYIPIPESREDNVSPAENFLLVNQQLNLTCPDDDGMEMTVPLGRLKRVKPKDTGRADSLEPKVIDETNLEVEDLGLTSPLVTSESRKCAYPVNDNERETSGNCELKINEANIDKSKIEGDNRDSTGEKCQARNSAHEIFKKQPFHHSDEQEERKIIADCIAKPIPEDAIVEKEVRTTSDISVIETEKDDKDGYPVIDEVPEGNAVVETLSVDTMHPSNLVSEHCNEKTKQSTEDKATVRQEDEERFSEHEAMEQSLSEAMEGEPEAACMTNAEFQTTETTFGGGELMDVCCTPTKKHELPEARKPVLEAMRPLDMKHYPANHLHIEVDPSMRVEREGYQFEKSQDKRKDTDINQSVRGNEFPPVENEKNVTFGDESHKEDDGMDVGMEFTVALGNLKPWKGENKIADAAPPPNNVSIDGKCGVDKLSSDSKCGSIIGPKASVIGPEVKSVGSGLVPTCEHLGQSLKDSSFSVVNGITIPSEEVSVECAKFSGGDSRVGDDDCVEPMDHVSDQDDAELRAVKSNGEMTSVHPSEADFGPMEESTECHEADELPDANNVKPCIDSMVGISSANPKVSSKPLTSIEDWIREESSKESCEWAVWKLLENQYSFMVFHEAAVLIVNLEPLSDGQDSKNARAIESILLKSCITDKSAWCGRLVIKVILERLSPSLLHSKCSSTEQLPRLFAYLDEEFLAMNLLLDQMYNLERVCPVDKKSDGFSFMVPSMKLLLLFEVKVTLLNWDKDGVKSKDVTVKNVFGKSWLAEIQSILQTVRCDENYLRNFYNEVLKFIYTLEEVLE